MFEDFEIPLYTKSPAFIRIWASNVAVASGDLLGIIFWARISWYSVVVRDKSSGKIYLYDQAGIMLLQYISILDYSYLLLLRQKNVAVMRMRLQYLFFIFFLKKKK